MASGRNTLREISAKAVETVFDRAHLVRYTMENPELEKEIIGLFLAQLPETMAMLRGAASAEAWKLATHTIKGSAAAVGARRINHLASRMEEKKHNLDVNVKSNLFAELDLAIEDFRAMADRIYSPL